MACCFLFMHVRISLLSHRLGMIIEPRYLKDLVKVM